MGKKTQTGLASCNGIGQKVSTTYGLSSSKGQQFLLPIRRHMINFSCIYNHTWCGNFKYKSVHIYTCVCDFIRCIAHYTYDRGHILYGCIVRRYQDVIKRHNSIQNDETVVKRKKTLTNTNHKYWTQTTGTQIKNRAWTRVFRKSKQLLACHI